MRLQQHIVNLLLIPLLTSGLSCSNEDRSDPGLSLHPGKGRNFQFSLLRTGIDTLLRGRIIADTFRLQGKLETMKEADSVTGMRFTFSSLQIRSSIPKLKMVMIDKKGRKRTENVSIMEERDALLSLLTGMHILLTIDKKGQVLAVEGLDLLLDSLSAMNRVAASSVRFTYEEYLSEVAIKDIFNRVFYLFPGKAVKVGEQWGNDITLVSKAPVLFSNMYKLEGVMNDTAIIHITSLISARAGKEGKTYMKGNQDGVAKVGRLQGFPLHLESASTYITTIDHYDSTGKEKLKIKREEKMVVDIATAF